MEQQVAADIAALENWQHENAAIKPSYISTIEHLLLAEGDPELDTVSSAVSHALGLRTLVSNPPPPMRPSFAPFSENELTDAFSLKALPGARAPRELRLGGVRSRGGGVLHGQPPRPRLGHGAASRQTAHHQSTQPPPPPPDAPLPMARNSAEAGVWRQEAMMEAVRRMINIKWPKGHVKTTADSYQRAGFPCGNIFAVKLTNPSNLVPAHYFDVVKQPMDLATVKQKVDDFGYSSLEEFAADVRLVYNNALLYNKKSNDVNNKMALILKNVVEAELAKIAHLAATHR
jgi:hypothetical protein